MKVSSFLNAKHLLDPDFKHFLLFVRTEFEFDDVLLLGLLDFLIFYVDFRYCEFDGGIIISSTFLGFGVFLSCLITHKA